MLRSWVIPYQTTKHLLGSLAMVGHPAEQPRTATGGRRSHDAHHHGTDGHRHRDRHRRLSPVNALPSAAWFDLADVITAAGEDPPTHVVILRSTGRGFNAGVDISEMQTTTGFDALIGANHGCAAAFRRLRLPRPRHRGRQRFLRRRRRNLVGNADIIVASDDAYFGLPEVDRGALGAATHLARLVPQHMMRTLYYTAQTVTAQQLLHFGWYRVVPADELLSLQPK